MTKLVSAFIPSFLCLLTSFLPSHSFFLHSFQLYSFSHFFSFPASILPFYFLYFHFSSLYYTFPPFFISYLYPYLPSFPLPTLFFSPNSNVLYSLLLTLPPHFIFHSLPSGYHRRIHVIDSVPMGRSIWQARRSRLTIIYSALPLKRFFFKGRDSLFHRSHIIASYGNVRRRIESRKTCTSKIAEGTGGRVSTKK